MIVLALALSALATIAVQAIAIVTLPPADYGLFAAAYLVSGLFCSFGLSIVCEPWSRGGRQESWPSVGAAAGALALLSIPAAAAIAVFLGDPIAAVAVTVAVAATTYRFCGRFHFAAVGAQRWVIPADGAALAVTLGSWAALAPRTDALAAVALAWAAGSVASALLMPRPAMPTIRRSRHWAAVHRREIRSLLADSTLLDLGAIALPLGLAPLLGPSDFGLYRALSSLAVPVRLVLLPIRPLIGGRPTTWHVTARALTTIGASAVALGLTAWACLATISAGGLFIGSTLDDAATRYGLLISVYIAVTFVGTYFYMVSRAHASGRALLVLRLVQLISAVAFQLVGLALAGLTGALVGATLAAAVQAVSVVGAAWRSRAAVDRVLEPVP